MEASLVHLKRKFPFEIHVVVIIVITNVFRKVIA